MVEQPCRMRVYRIRRFAIRALAFRSQLVHPRHPHVRLRQTLTCPSPPVGRIDGCQCSCLSGRYPGAGQLGEPMERHLQASWKAWRPAVVPSDLASCDDYQDGYVYRFQLRQITNRLSLALITGATPVTTTETSYTTVVAVDYSTLTVVEEASRSSDPSISATIDIFAHTGHCHRDDPRHFHRDSRTSSTRPVRCHQEVIQAFVCRCKCLDHRQVQNHSQSRMIVLRQYESGLRLNF